MTNSRHQTIQEYKRRYEEILATLDNKTWREYWNVMLRNYEWVDYIFIQSTAWFLRQDIIIVTTSSTENHPYITISGNLADERVPCQGIPLTIGTKSNVHYQSLLPIEVRVPRKIVPSSPENTIDLELKVAMSSEKNGHPDLVSRDEFPDLKPSNDKEQVQPRASTSRREMERPARQTIPGEIKLNKSNDMEQQNLNHNQKIETPAGPDPGHKKKAFKHVQEGKILDFQFVSEKRVKCPKCKKRI